MLRAIFLANFSYFVKNVGHTMQPCRWVRMCPRACSSVSPSPRHSGVLGIILNPTFVRIPITISVKSLLQISNLC